MRLPRTPPSPTLSQSTAKDMSDSQKTGKGTPDGKGMQYPVKLEALLRACFPLLRSAETKQAISYLEAMEEQAVLKAPRADVINLPPAKLNTLRRLFELYDLDGSGLVSSSEIADALRKNKDVHATPDQEAKKGGPRSLERSRSTLTEDEGGQASIGLGVDGLSMAEIENMIDMFDDDGNRELSMDEFVYAFKDAV